MIRALRDTTTGLKADDELDLLAGSPGHAVGVPAQELRHDRDLVRMVRSLPGWNVDTAAEAARRWADVDLSSEVANLGQRLDTEDADGGLFGWAEVPALATMCAVAVGANSS